MRSSLSTYRRSPEGCSSHAIPCRAMAPKAGPISVTGAWSSLSGCIAALRAVDETAHDHADVVCAASFVTQTDQAFSGLSRRVAPDNVGDVFVRQQTVQAIATQHDHVGGT